MKTVELRQMNEDELLAKLNDCEEELFNLRFKQAISPLDNPKRMTLLRKTIARIKFLLHEKKSLSGSK